MIARGKPRQRGYALAAAIFIAFLVAIVAAGTQTVTSGVVRQATRQRAQLRADWAAEAGVVLMLDTLRQGAAPATGLTVEQTLHQARCSASVEPATPDFAAAMAPGAATRDVVLITGVGEALRNDQVEARSRVSLLAQLRPAPQGPCPIAWLPGQQPMRNETP